ncbi:zinc finger protein 14 [Zeugodacus cucurbitae]|uniref:Zinc finger protein 100 n=1 Tax=Zeugodacus cucurbitae TaxID=28588 RepID=A0A0A1WKW9_ZEUCU|nr:zinc finger protein 14 [Zeugodacus cucurbitae]
MREITHENMQSFCRTCLDELGDKSSLLGEKFSVDEHEDIEKLLVLCNSTTTADCDDLPQYICYKCHKKLQFFNDFRDKIMQSHLILKNIIREHEDTSRTTEDEILLDSGQGSEDQQDNSVEISDIEVFHGYTYSTRSREKLQNCIENTVVKILQDPGGAHNVSKDLKEEIFDEVAEEIEIDISDIKMNENNSSDDEDTLDDFEFSRATNDEQNVDRLQHVDISIQTTDVQNSECEEEYSKSSSGNEECTQKFCTRGNTNRTKIINPKVTPQKKPKKLARGGNNSLRKSPAKQSRSSFSEVKFQCEQCPRRCVTWENYEAHLRTHQGLKPYSCNECDRSFNRAAHFRAHVREVHGPVTLQYICSFEGCGKIFKRENTYKNHYRLKHTVMPYEAREPKTYVCEDCGRTFKSVTTLKEHRYKHAPEEDYPFKCEECGKRYRSKRTYKDHQLRHSGIKNYICTYCGMKKTTQNELRAHINYHTKEKQWPCPKCPSVFNSSGNLGMHDRIVHKGIRPFTCRFCDLSFGKQDTLKHHEMRHTGEKPHGCELCGKRFIQIVALRAHMKTHNRGLTRKPIVSSVAEQPFETIEESAIEVVDSDLELPSCSKHASC